STDWQTLCIVEVKSRTDLSGDFSAADNFSAEKLSRLERVADDFLNRYSVEWRRRRLRKVRHDLLTVTFLPGFLFGSAVLTYFPEVNGEFCPATSFSDR